MPQALVCVTPEGEKWARWWGNRGRREIERVDKGHDREWRACSLERCFAIPRERGGCHVGRGKEEEHDTLQTGGRNPWKHAPSVPWSCLASHPRGLAWAYKLWWRAWCKQYGYESNSFQCQVDSNQLPPPSFLVYSKCHCLSLQLFFSVCKWDSLSFQTPNCRPSKHPIFPSSLVPIKADAATLSKSTALSTW